VPILQGLLMLLTPQDDGLWGASIQPCTIKEGVVEEEIQEEAVEKEDHPQLLLPTPWLWSLQLMTSDPWEPYWQSSPETGPKPKIS
jgi:hypothetical protein